MGYRLVIKNLEGIEAGDHFSVFYVDSFVTGMREFTFCLEYFFINLLIFLIKLYFIFINQCVKFDVK